MSIPHNELGKFRSYAYHHILMVCNSTATANELVNTSEITRFQHPYDKERFSARQIGNNEKNEYITLIDGTSDARFYITAASWENIIAMEDYTDVSNIPQSTSMSLEGEIEIMEPLGANFLNVLTDVCDTLDTDPVGLLFVLKTIFVGHNTDGTTEMISNIKPLLFINYDITAIFDSAGAKYKLAFVGAVNGFGKLPHLQQIVNGFSFKMGSDVTLAETFNQLADAINGTYDDFKNRATSDFAKTTYQSVKKEGKLLSAEEAAERARSFFNDNYRPVKYKIIANDYAKPQYKAGDNTNVRIANKLEDGSYNFGTNVGIETIIKKIMATSTGVLNDGKVDAQGKRYIYKISSGLNSTDSEIVAEYYINRYEMLMLPYEAAFEGKEYIPADGQSIEFNYIFTGKNVDIKEFDIKMEMGMAFFQLAATTDTYPDQKTSAGGYTSQTYQASGANPVASKNKKQRGKTPLFLGSKLAQPMSRNTKNPIDSATFQALLNRHAALENIAVKMTIYGNIMLLGEMQILPSDLIKNEIKKPEKEKTINPQWLKTPTLIKVNIKMPVDTNDVNTEYRDFWYTGYYTLFSVRQIFNQGEFLQELDMLSIPVADKIQEATDKPTEVETTKEQDKTVYSEIEAEFNIKTDPKSNLEETKVGKRRTNTNRV